MLWLAHVGAAEGATNHRPISSIVIISIRCCKKTFPLVRRVLAHDERSSYVSRCISTPLTTTLHIAVTCRRRVHESHHLHSLSVEVLAIEVRAQEAQCRTVDLPAETSPVADEIVVTILCEIIHRHLEKKHPIVGTARET